MNKQYKTIDLYGAWLFEVGAASLIGLKNIIGLKVLYHDSFVFYSIFDDCFFQIFSPEHRTFLNDIGSQLLVEVYEYQSSPCEMKTLGMELYQALGRPFVSKEDLVTYKNLFTGYFLDVEENRFFSAKVNHEDETFIKPYLIDSISMYEEKLKRTLSL